MTDTWAASFNKFQIVKEKERREIILIPGTGLPSKCLFILRFEPGSLPGTRNCTEETGTGLKKSWRGQEDSIKGNDK